MKNVSSPSAADKCQFDDTSVCIELVLPRQLLSTLPWDLGPNERGGREGGGAITVYIHGCCNIRNWRGGRRPFRSPPDEEPTVRRRRHATRANI